MREISIDLHILKELVYNDKQMEKIVKKIDKLYNEAKALLDENRALYKHLAEVVKLDGYDGQR